MDTSIDRSRFNMIQQQIRPWNVADDQVLSVMADVPRERFVPDAYRSVAHADIEIPLGDGQTMLAPKVVGRMLQALTVQADDKILEIGTGSGYVAACLSRLGGRVISTDEPTEPGSDACSIFKDSHERVAPSYFKPEFLATSRGPAHERAATLKRTMI